jgi:hypothetical protein
VLAINAFPALILATINLVRRTISCTLIGCVLLMAAACAAHPAVSRGHSVAASASAHAGTSASARAVTPSGREVLARARSAFLSAASVTVNVESTSAGDNAPPFPSWTETVTATGKTTDPNFTSGDDPITCSSLATCAAYYFNTEGYPLGVGTVGLGIRGSWLVYARGSADLGLPGWQAVIDAGTYAPITIVAGWSCTHCYYLTYHFRLTSSR